MSTAFANIWWNWNMMTGETAWLPKIDVKMTSLFQGFDWFMSKCSFINNILFLAMNAFPTVEQSIETTIGKVDNYIITSYCRIFQFKN